MHPPIDMSIPILPATTPAFGELAQLLPPFRALLQGVQHQFAQFTRYIQDPAARETAHALAAAQQRQDGLAEQHFRLAEQYADTALTVQCYRVLYWLQTGQFAQINRLLQTVDFTRHAHEQAALTYMAQTALNCGLLETTGQILRLLDGGQAATDIAHAAGILSSFYFPEEAWTELFLAAKAYVHRQAGPLIQCGVFYSIIDDALFSLMLMIDEPDMARLSEINNGFTEFLLDYEDAHGYRLPADMDIAVHGIQEWQP